MANPNFECRMYESRLPDVDMVVMVEVKSIDELGRRAYVSLLEYNNIPGVILSSEISDARNTTIGSYIRVGEMEPVKVLHVEEEKGYINLSRKSVTSKDIRDCEERFNKSKSVHSIMKSIAETTNFDLQDLYISVGWPLYHNYNHAFKAFKYIVNAPGFVLNLLTREVKETGPDGEEVTKEVHGLSDLPLEVKDVLISTIKRRMTSKIRAVVELKCFEDNGVLHIQTAMEKAEAAGKKDCRVVFKLIFPPSYVLVTQTLDEKLLQAGILLFLCENTLT